MFIKQCADRPGRGYLAESIAVSSKRSSKKTLIIQTIVSFQLPGGLCFNQREVREINSFSKQYAVPFKLFKLFDGQAIPTRASPICIQRVLQVGVSHRNLFLALSSVVLHLSYRRTFLLNIANGTFLCSSLPLACFLDLCQAHSDHL